MAQSWHINSGNKGTSSVETSIEKFDRIIYRILAPVRVYIKEESKKT